ncbi:MAG: hypothetical protein RJB01_1263, partial [Actinomycetota bacterium]
MSLLADSPGSFIRHSLADVVHAPLWTDSPDAPAPHPPLLAPHSTDLLIIGGGFTGLWTAIEAKQRDPQRDVTLVEGASIAHGGSGRNGGFISASLTHGLAHGEAIWPQEMPTLVRLGRENLAAIADVVAANSIECNLDLVGKTAIALTEHARASLPSMLELHQKWGEDVELLAEDEMRADVHSPTYLGGLRVRSGGGLMDPAR